MQLYIPYCHGAKTTSPDKTQKETNKKAETIKKNQSEAYTTIEVRNRCDYVFPQLLIIGGGGDPCVVQYNAGRRGLALTECACSHSSFSFKHKLMKLDHSGRKVGMPEGTSSGNQAK